ncbi:MAG: alpha-galactosidase [Candidatus Symbiothrix sp.]|jgi:hypothetical protein|nr:alpha-galactosidase [Candidatus Symbiothrix sp.]
MKLNLFTLSILFLTLGIRAQVMAQEQLPDIPPTCITTGDEKNISSQFPMMGWSSWNANRININETLIKETADYVVSLGLKDVGYTWINTDDGFFGSRDAKGNLLVNSKFPNGMKTIADYIHAKGLNAGIYSEAGKNTCAYKWDNDKTNGLNAGLFGHVGQDLRLFFQDWGFEFIKVDYCGAEDQQLDEKTTYTQIADTIKKIETETGKDIRFNVCRWNFPGTWVSDIADSWRMYSDINNKFSSIKTIIEKNTYLSAYASPGHYNDMDMLQVGRGMNIDEEKTHFGMWCIMSSPIMIGCNLKNIPAATLDVIKNTEVIAVNQDSLGLQAQIVARNGNTMVFAKQVEVANGKIRAVALFNGENSVQTIRVMFDDIQLSEKAQVRDLWTHTNLGTFTKYYETSVPAHGTAMLRIEGENAIEKTCYQGEDAFLNDFSAIASGSNFAHPEAVNTAIASGGYKLAKLGHASTNWAEFRNVYSLNGGTYTFKVFYYSPENRNLQVSVNGKIYLMKKLNSGNINTRGEAGIKIRLKPGNNVIRLNSNKTSDWAPDIDMFELIASGKL